MAIVRLLRGHGWVLPVVLTAVVMLLPFLGLSVYMRQQVVLIAVFTLIVSGLNLSWGYGGQLALGQVALFAGGAYTTAILLHHGIRDMAVAIPLSMLVAGLLGLITGLPGFRLKGWALALSSFFLVLLIPNLVSLFEEETGGHRGLFGIIKPTFLGLPLAGPTFFVFALVVTLLWLLALRNLVTSRYGLALQVMQQSPQLAESLASSLGFLRVSAYVIGALPAGIAGSIFAYHVGIVVPTSFTLAIAISIIAASLVGGATSVWGAPVGAALLVLGPLQAAAFEKYSLLVYGVFLILVGTVFRGGITGLTRRLMRRFTVTEEGPRDGEGAAANLVDLRIPGERLVVQSVAKDFGGVKALAGADLTAEPGRITALMGANGAGKTTLLNAISGMVAVDAGSILLGDQQLVGRKPAEIARLGVGRTFQTPQIPEHMSVLEVVESGRLRVGRVGLWAALLRTPRFRRMRHEDRAAAMEALRFAGLAHLAHQEATALPLGTRRLLEVVRSVAGAPSVLLLDEPAAGLDDAGLDELRQLLTRAREAGATIVLVEHNVPFLLSVADHVVVMDLGKTLVTGSPEEVRNNEVVIGTYLGRRRGLAANDERIAGAPVAATSATSGKSNVSTLGTSARREADHGADA